MNRTNFEHLMVALVLQGLLWLAAGDWLIGAVASTFLFIGREHAQREYKLGDPSKLIGYEALDFWNWSRDALLDLIIPIAGVLFVWGVYA